MPIPRHKLETHLLWWEQCIRGFSGTMCRRRHSESRVFTHWDYVCFTVSPSLGLPVFWLFCLVSVWLFGVTVLLFVLFCWLSGFPLFCIWDAQVRRHFQDCHHRHDERSNGAKKNLPDWRAPPATFVASVVSHWSFLVKKESSCAYMTRSGKKSMSSLYSFLEVNRMHHLADWKRGNK